MRGVWRDTRNPRSIEGISEGSLASVAVAQYRRAGKGGGDCYELELGERSARQCKGEVWEYHFGTDFMN